MLLLVEFRNLQLLFILIGVVHTVVARSQTHTYTLMFWPRQALRPTWLFYHLLPQKCFSSSFPLWKTEFMTCHVFLLTAQAVRCLCKWFPSYFSCLTKHLMTQVASKVCNSICHWILLCGTVTVMFWLQAFSTELAVSWAVCFFKADNSWWCVWMSIKLVWW